MSDITRSEIEAVITIAEKAAPLTRCRRHNMTHQEARRLLHDAAWWSTASITLKGVVIDAFLCWLEGRSLTGPTEDRRCDHLR